MPEGDTIHKLANFLAPRLEAHTVRRVSAPDPSAARQCAGQRVRRVFARGKHLFIEFDNGHLLRSHLGMYGSWHRYGHGEAWRKPRRQASLELATDAEVFVCFNAKEVELLHGPGVRRRITRKRAWRTTGDRPQPALEGWSARRAAHRLRAWLNRIRSSMPAKAPLSAQGRSCAQPSAPFVLSVRLHSWAPSQEWSAWSFLRIAH